MQFAMSDYRVVAMPAAIISASSHTRYLSVRSGPSTSTEQVQPACARARSDPAFGGLAGRRTEPSLRRWPTQSSHLSTGARVHQKGVPARRGEAQSGRAGRTTDPRWYHVAGSPFYLTSGENPSVQDMLRTGTLSGLVRNRAAP